MFEHLAEQWVAAICAVLHDATVTKSEHKHLGFKEDQWELLSQLLHYYSQAPTDDHHCLQFEAQCFLFHHLSCDQLTPL